MDEHLNESARAGDNSVDNPRLTRPLVLYDEDCGFCTTSALATQTPWFRAQVTVTAFQRVDLAVHNLTVDKCAESLHVVDIDGSAHVGSDAVAVVFRESRFPWPLVGGVLRLPGIRWVAQKVYAIVARNRYRLPGGTAACRLD
ncbi:DUF393 domain-containing protein [Tessaracoccus sp. MC1865]|uniref:thiol-disulfide oxidoreductase DCC family protein n=1 Tax=Tessaracoccus sp. MC1865 TaxID=2760310 RepID=UPI0016006726|nr:DUF393 domain-containing protein [Tessaracoccus sp. MC1865]MBB1483117.1 DUF393 domain-containing protein [Tessaracoccus sp. MC1865]QTO37454.1 DUF393 domain-containing protein [Tessaracoccus sp. MC1865]